MNRILLHRSLIVLTACLPAWACAQGAATGDMVWPKPGPGQIQPENPQTPDGIQWQSVHVRPNFQAPSATHCARPIQTRELSGQPVAQTRAISPRHKSHIGAEPPVVASGMPAAEPVSPEYLADRKPYPAAAPGGASSEIAYDSIASRTPSPRISQQGYAPVTVGMVDDNADFGEYLAYRARTQVAHQELDISERYLLQVRDARGRSVADAEVAVRSPGGYAMWARTDTAGRIWLHPNAFDPHKSGIYEITVRKAGKQSQAYLQRGQKQAVEVVLGNQSMMARARLDLVFLIDATGSMGDEIDKLKHSLHSIAREVSQLPSKPDLCFGMVAYRDKGDEFIWRAHDFTNNLNAFQGVLNQLRATGGGDMPESMNEALHETVHSLSWRGDGATRLVVLLADAPPHLDYGGPQYDDDTIAALGKGIKIFSVGASGLDPQGEFIQRQIAQYTGGRFVFLTYANAADPASGPGKETVHDVKNYSVDTLDRLIVRLVKEELAHLPQR